MVKFPFVVPVDPAKKLTVAAAFIYKVDVVSGCAKFKVAAWFTFIFPVFHAAWFDQVPVPLKYT